MYTYAKKLKEYRTKRKLTQMQLAEKLQMPQGNYSRLEKGEQDIKFTMIMHICKTLNVSSDWLLGLNQE